MYQQDLQFSPGLCPVPVGPGPGPGPSPGAVLGDFFPDTDRTQPRSHVIKATPRSRPRSSRRSETEARYGWCPVPYQAQVRPNTGGNPQPMMMPPRGHVNQQTMVRQRAVDVTSNTMMWQDRPGPPPLPPPPPPPTRLPPYPSAERPYEYSQPPPNMNGGGESFPGAMHGHMPPPGQQPLPPPQYQNMPPYDYHGAPECAWRQMPMCHSASRPQFAPPQYSTPPQQQQQQQQTRQYYHNPAARQGGMPNVQYVPQYQQNPEAPPGTWAPPPPPPPGHNNRASRYATGQQQQQVMTLPPMTTPPPGHYYIMERPPSQPLVQMYDAPEKDNSAPPPPAYYNPQQRNNNMQTPNQQPRLYGQQQSVSRYGQPVVQSGPPVGKPRGHHPSKQYQDHQQKAAYNQLMHHDMGHMGQNHQVQSKPQYAPFNTSAEQVVTNETSGNIQQYPYFYRYSETVKTSQPLTDHCDMSAGGQHMNSHSCGDHALPVVSHQTKSTIISSKSVSEVQMLVGVSGGSVVASDYRLPAHVERPMETPSASCGGHVETAAAKMAARPKQQTSSSVTKHGGNGGNCQVKKHSVRSEACGLGKEKSAKVSKRSGTRLADARCGQPSTRGSCKRRLSDSSEVGTLVDRDRVYSQSNGPCGEQQENDSKPVPKLDLGKLDLCDDESDFEDVPDTHFKCRSHSGTTPMAGTSNGGCAFLEAISKETKNRAAKLLESKSKDDPKYDPFNPGSATSFEYSIDAENLVARLCYSSPEASPPSSAQRHQLGCDATGQEVADGRNRLLQESSLGNVYTSHEQSRVNEQHVSSEAYGNDLELLDINGMMAGECDNAGGMGDNNGTRNIVALNDCVVRNDAVWKEGIVLISKGLGLLKSCKSKDVELNKRFELMVYELERISRRGIVPDVHNSFLRLEETSSQQHQYSSRLSYVDQLYEYKSKMVSSEDTTDIFDIFPPVNAELPNVRDYIGEQMNEESQLLDSTFSLSTGSKSVMTTPVQSQEINWRQYNEDGCQEENANIVCDQDGVDGSKWVRAGGERFPYSEQSFNIAKQMTDQHSGRRDFTPNSPYDSYTINKDSSMDGRMPWSGKPWDSYPNVNTADDMYQQSMFYQQNHFDQLLQVPLGFGSGQHQNDLGMLCRNEIKDAESPSPFQVNSSATIKDALSFTQRQLSNCEQDIHYLQSAASKVAPVRSAAGKKIGGTSCTSASTTKIRRRTTGQTSGAGDADGADLDAPTCTALIDTESDDNASYYMKPGNYLVPKKAISARLRTEKKAVTRNKRKAFSAPARTSIFIPYPLDPVVPPLPQLPQNPTSLFGTSDVSLPQEPSRLTVPSANLINDAEHFPSSGCHQTFSPIAKLTKEIKKTNSPIISSNTKERKKKDNPRVQYPKAPPKEVRQFQILKRVSKVIGKVDSTTGSSEIPAQISGLNSVIEPKNCNSKNTGSETATKIGTNEKEGMSHEMDRTTSSLQSLTIHESVSQQRSRKNAAMKSILNFKVKSKISEKSTPNNDAHTVAPVPRDLDRRDAVTIEAPNIDISTSSQSTSQDMSELNLVCPSPCQVSANERNKPTLTATDDSKTYKASDISQQSQTPANLNVGGVKIEAFTKILGAEPARTTMLQPQRVAEGEHYATPVKSRGGTEASSTAGVANPPSSRVTHRGGGGSSVASKSVYALKVNASAPNISLDRGGGGSRGRLAAATADPPPPPRGATKDSPLSRQFSECREKLDRLNAQQKVAPGKVPLNAGSDDSSSTVSINSSRHRRGPTPVALGKFEKILRSVWNLPEAQFIKHNVSSSELHEYYQIVKYPIFLENIETKLKNRYYMTIEDIVHDFRQILFNSRLYFKESPPVLMKTDIIENRVNELLNEYFSGWDFRQITGDPAERLRNRR